MKDSMYIPRFRSICLLMMVVIFAIESKFYLIASNSMYHANQLENQMFNSFGANMMQNLMPKKKPLLVLHVGPSMTGAYSIDKTLSKDEALLQSDNYTFIGVGAMKKSKSYHCNETITTGCTRTLSPDLIEMLGKEDKNLVGSNVLLSTLEDEKRQAWVDATANTRDVNVVIDYVRLHELLPGRYNEHYEKKKSDSNWPGIKGSLKAPTFSEYLANTADLDDHESVRSYEAWGKDFPVSIFNVHQGGDLSTKFVCQQMKGANQLCRKLASGPDKGKKKRNGKRGSHLLSDYDMLAVHAFEQGLVHESDKRQELVEAIEEHLKRTNHRLPRTCPDRETLEKVYYASRKFESWALWMGAARPAMDFDASWRKAMKKKELCSVDPAAALVQDFWRNFFRLRYVQKSSQLFFH